MSKITQRAGAQVSRTRFSMQLEFPLQRARLPDRNFHKGGRSFYFFDFDDNVMRLDTTISIFGRRTGEEKALSTREFAQISHLVGRTGVWKDFEVRANDLTGSFRRFRDLPDQCLGRQRQPFIDDVAAALKKSKAAWRGPSWEVFSHAVFNERPIAIITARGHHPDTMRAGLALLLEHKYLPAEPNYLAIFTVSHPAIAGQLGDSSRKRSVPELKWAAIIRSVDIAMERYGENPFHRFGISDDDPNNLALILDAMAELKRRYRRNSFFVINTGASPIEKTEVLAPGDTSPAASDTEQLALFPSPKRT
jgi:hypothetical protein